jgi:hypothetical protein
LFWTEEALGSDGGEVGRAWAVNDEAGRQSGASRLTAGRGFGRVLREGDPLARTTGGIMVRRVLAQMRAQWAGFLALFLVIAGGTAYAANTIHSSDIIDGEVKTADVANNAVRTEKIANGQVTAADLVPSEPWHAVAAGSATADRCANPSVTAVFCSYMVHGTGGDFFYPWHNYGGVFATAAFYKDEVGVVHLKGLVGYGQAGGSAVVREFPIFRLPVDYRPTKRRVFASVGASGDAEVSQGRVDVQPNGLVTFVQACGNEEGVFLCSASGTDVTLDGITFRPSG